MMTTFCLALTAILAAAPSTPGDIAFQEKPGQLAITVGGEPLATYCYADKVITRPYFAHVHVRGGIQITRNHPPIEGQDPVDHATFHPGIWLAFGDINGEDYWRVRTPVRHERFVHAPQSSGKTATFTVENSYRVASEPDREVCREISRYTIESLPEGVLLVSDSRFFSPQPFTFGDQEEMGLGVRVATPIAVKSGGQMIDAAGRKNEKEIWSKSAAWCDYSGIIKGRHVGLLIMPDPENFRPARFHARDYGLLAANPFGQKVFGESTESHVTVKPGESLTLRFGVLLHADADKDLDRQVAYDAFLGKLGKLARP